MKHGTIAPTLALALLAGCAGPGPLNPEVTPATFATLPTPAAGYPHPEATLAVIARPKADDPEDEHADEELGYGPPPPEYVKITAQPVPGWTPEQMQNAPDGPGSWTPMGPSPITNEYWSGNANAAGRVASIAVDPTNPARAFIGSASGGVWRTTDSGASWTPLTDELSILTHGWVTLDPTNPSTIYAGTGEYVTGSGGDGLFKSTDGGSTWSRIATASQVGSNISRVAVDPSNTQIIHVTSSGGYYRTTSGGASWSQVLTSACSDLAVNPATPGIVYVGRANDGVYKSTNSGQSFTRIWPIPSDPNARRVVLALAPSSPGTVYCAITNPSNGLLGLYKTTDHGATWAQLTNTPNFPSPQAWYDTCVIVSPTNPDLVFCGGVFPSYAVAGIIRSTDGGASWTDVTVGGSGGQVHPDMQSFAFGPDGTLWVACDGGVWRTTNNGQSWINCNSNLVLAQNYALALHPTDSGRIIGGTQDNGTIQRTTSNAWPQILSGDGGFSAYDFANPSRRYVTYVYLAVYRQLNSNTTNISGPWGNDSRNFIAPLVMDPNDSRTLLGGTNRVWRTTSADGTPNWTAISTTTVSSGGTLNAIAVAPGFSNTIYVGSTQGTVYYTANASTWLNRSTGLPSGQVSEIVIDPADPAHAFVTFYNTTGARVLETSNAGLTWTNITGALPAGVSAKCLAVDWRFAIPGLWVGSGAGLYWSYDRGATWARDGADFPNVIVNDLLINPATNTITAGTYGRGTWRATLPGSPPAPCYANCDGSTTPPLVNVLDLNCFLNRFAAGDSWANCDSSTVVPILNVLDFNCFLNKFAAGCP
jgi:photosystem II stability/assembly factor-like uncharacterized protein